MRNLVYIFLSLLGILACSDEIANDNIYQLPDGKDTVKTDTTDNDTTKTDTVVDVPTFKGGYNPILPPWEHIPDGEPRVFGNRVYLYGSHDNAGQTMYCDTLYHVWSASLDDLNNWSFHGVSFSTRGGIDNNGVFYPDNVSWSDNYLYAPDVIENNGKYYLYAYVVGSNCAVGVSDVPEGPFDEVTKLKAPAGAPADFGGWGQYIDPGVFVDDDGRTYLYWGYKGSHMAELDSKTMDQVLPDTYQKDIIPVEEPYGFFEGASMRKINGKYYFIYAHGGILDYAISDKPTGPFEYGGHIIRNGNKYPGGNIHGSLCEINGQWYIFYHRMTNNTLFSRKACVERVTINPDGSIDEVEMTSLGFNESLDPYVETPAYAACYLTGGNYITQVDSLTHPVINNKTNSVIGFRYFDFGSGSSKMTVSAKLRAQYSGTIEVWIDGPDSGSGKNVGLLFFDESESWTEIKSDIEQVSGRHAVFFKIKSSTSGVSLCDFLSFKISKD